MYYNRQLAEEVNSLAQCLFDSVRNDILIQSEFSWQEVSIIVDCFLRMYNELENLLHVDDSEMPFRLLDIYNNSYKDIIDLRVNTSHLHTISCFYTITNHLCEKGLLRNLVFYLYDEIGKKQKEWENATLDVLRIDFLNPPSKYSPVECIQEMIKCNYCTSQDWLSVKKNSDNVFFTYTIADKYGNLIIDCGNNSNCKFFNFAACIWPFHDGYARVLCKNGKWGYISVENNTVQLIDEKVLYADDYSCERARIQMDDSNFRYLGLCLEDCFGRSFTKASTFYNGYALVSDVYCSNYHIDVFGNVTEEDKERYELNKANYKKNKKEESMLLKKLQHKRNTSTDDWESIVMDSLSGHGYDPEYFGY